MSSLLELFVLRVVLFGPGSHELSSDDHVDEGEHDEVHHDVLSDQELFR